MSVRFGSERLTAASPLSSAGPLPRGAVGGRGDDGRIDDLLGGDDDAGGGEGGLFLLAEDPPQVTVAFGVGPLDVDDGDVRGQRRDGDDQAAGVGGGEG